MIAPLFLYITIAALTVSVAVLLHRLERSFDRSDDLESIISNLQADIRGHLHEGINLQTQLAESNDRYRTLEAHAHYIEMKMSSYETRSANANLFTDRAVPDEPEEVPSPLASKLNEIQATAKAA